MRASMVLNRQMSGLIGEQITNDSKMVFVTETNFPRSLYNNEEKFNAHKMIVVVRNPLDVIPFMA